jgi:amidase
MNSPLSKALLAQASRRDFFRAASFASVAAVLPSFTTSSARGASYATSTDKSDDITAMSAAKLAQLIREKKISATEAVKAYVERHHKINHLLNAVIMPCHERAFAEAKAADEALARGELKGALHGVPMTIKDSIETEGVISTGGTMGRMNYVGKKDATCVARLRKSGAILLGKSNTPEFTLASGVLGVSTTNNIIYGLTRNPYDTSRSVSGSSGGAGAGVAAGLASFDIGSDWGGSIRGPAHNNGIAGIKPTSVRVPRTGHIVDYGGVFDLWQQLGPMTRRVEDIALITPIISGPDFHDASCAPVPWADPAKVDLKKLKVAFFPTNGVTDTDDDTKKTVIQAARWLEGAVASIKEDLPKNILSDLYAARTKLTNGDGWAFLKRAADKMGSKAVSSSITDRLANTKPISSAEYVEAWEQQDETKSRMLEWMKPYDVLLCPVAGKPAQPIDAGITPPSGTPNWSYTGAFNTTGWPVVVVRCGTSADGKLPIGVQVVAPPWREDLCLAVASYLEARSGGWQRPPI